MIKPIRPIRIESNLAYITLTKGYVAIIDAADVPLIDAWNWHALIGENTVYGRRTTVCMPRTNMLLHRALMSPSPGLEVDHRSGDGLDCRRSNMRLATHAQNGCNQRLSNANSSGYKGVCWAERSGKWRARIIVGGKEIYLGLFDTTEAAHAAYTAASARLHGKFGRAA